MRTWLTLINGSLLMALVVVAVVSVTGNAQEGPQAEKPDGDIETNSAVAPCVAFGPYVDGLDPNTGPHPTPGQIDALLDALVRQTGFRCIMTYGVLNGLDYTFEAAESRGLSVTAIIWLDADQAINDQSIERGIQVAKTYSNTIERISCGSEFRTRHGTGSDSVIMDCVTRLRAAGVTQPITSIDTWWEWCNRSWPCQASTLGASVDWIGINVFPWWENKYSGLFPCTSAADAADFHVARYSDVAAIYPAKHVVITEFGWPAGPDGYTQANAYTGQRCGVASEANQRTVVQSTLSKLKSAGIRGTVFGAFREGAWKARAEGPAGPYWGICDGAAPYACGAAYGYDLDYQVLLPALRRGGE